MNLGYSPKQWQTGLTVMPKKKQGVILVSKLWAILLMETDSNFDNKTIFGHHMMHFAEDRNDIAGECASGHQHHEAMDVALNCQLFCNINNDKLSEMHSVFTDIAMNLGYSPNQWQTGLTVMPKKKQGVILVSKLWAILLMETDSNFDNKTIFGHHMMHFAEDRNDIAGECASGHQHHEAMDVALNCQLFCNIACQKKCALCTKTKEERM
jgi:hypothetical protein